MTNSRKRDAITECFGSYKRMDIRKGKETAGSDSDLDPMLDVPGMSTLANKFRYYNSQVKALGEEKVGIKSLVQRPIDEASFTNSGVKQLLRDIRLLGTVKLANTPHRLLFENSVVREFHANLKMRAKDDDSGSYCKVYIRGAMFDFNPTKLNEILGTRNGGRFPTTLDNEWLALTGAKMVEWPIIGHRHSHLTKVYDVLHEIGCSNWFPTNNSYDVSVDQVVPLCNIGRGLNFDMGEFIFRHILDEADRVHVVLSFHIIIFSLLYE
ncbi:PREDICTED: uncharacterized protein LOC105956541 [Erythranthe guttata]|uniref:uncharacterized protein LOC105956541 n=1 Tax=Erythranthe guttata TaxID=4155 RepID=UPI00064DF8D4|nr:PREDICTED: uncharacterized protein LOC105956541 [Erythranthe guttata]|eukprot:XP_012835842.1 PREDICTED: uncharacterized protein LOC105956541 [Erythranthe guttata]